MSLDPGLPSAVWQAVLPWFAKLDRWRLPIGELGDQLIQAATDAVRLRFPELTPDDRSLTLLGKDRRIPRAPNETPEAYARRLMLWLDLWGIAGLPLGLLYAIQSFIFPGYPQVRLVERSGLWYTLDEGASRDMSPFDAMSLACTVEPGRPAVRYVPPIGIATSPRAAFWAHRAPGLWDWDSISNPERATHNEDFWLIVYPTSYPFQGEYNGAGDEEVTWGEDESWGFNEPAGTIATLRELVKIYARAGSECRGAVFAPSLVDFPPDATIGDPTFPDGHWGADAKDVAGVATPTRRADCRYLLWFP
jgi:hypothetical protein